MRMFAAAGVAVVLVACTAMPPASELIAVPTQSPGPFIEIGRSCPDALLAGTLVADDESGFIVQGSDGFVSPVVWPHGYVARDTDPRQLLDGAGTVVAREGDHFSGGGGWLGPTDAAGFTVCGGFDITPAG